MKLYRPKEYKGHALSGLKLVVGTPDIYEQLRDEQRAKIYIWGVALGFVPIALSWFFSWWFLLAIPIYLFACKKDIKMVFEIYSNKS